MRKLFLAIMSIAAFILVVWIFSTPKQSIEDLVSDSATTEEIAAALENPDPIVPDTAFEYKANFLKLNKEKDEFEGITWYKTTSLKNSNIRNKVHVYVGESEMNVWTRIYVCYSGDDWIFFDRVIFLVDGKPIELHFDQFNHKSTEVVSGGVYEWVDVPGIDYDILLSKIIMADNVKIKLSGKYSNSWTLSKSEIANIKDAVKGYYYLKSIK